MNTTAKTVHPHTFKRRDPRRQRPRVIRETRQQQEPDRRHRNEADALSNQAVTNNSARPTLAITGPTTETKDAFTVTFTFNRAVTGFAASDVTVTRGNKGAFTETTTGTVWTLIVTPDADEDDNDVRVAVAQGAATANGIGNAAASKDFDVDTKPPALSTAASTGTAWC